MTLTEKVTISIGILGVILLFMGVWPLTLMCVGLLGYVLFNDKQELLADPSNMGLVAPFGSPSKTLILNPRVMFVHEGFPLFESIIPIPKGNLKDFNFAFKDIECALTNTPDDQDIGDNFKVGGTVIVEIGFVAQVIQSPSDAYNFVKNRREVGTQATLSQRLEAYIRDHAKHRRWEKFAGEKKVFADKLNGSLRHLLQGLGIQGEFEVKNITPAKGLAEAAGGAAREELERRTEKLDNATAIKNANAMVAASKKAGDNPPLSFETAMSIVQTNRGGAKRVIVTNEGNGSGGQKAQNLVVTDAVHNATKEGGNDEQHSSDEHNGN